MRELHLYLYDYEFKILCTLQHAESFSRTIARAIKMVAAAERREPPEGVYRSANGDLYTVKHFEEFPMTCFECKQEKPTRTCNVCARAICDADWGVHGKACFTFPQHASPGPVEGSMDPQIAFPAAKPDGA